MGPKKGLSDEKKEEMFEAWKNSAEYGAIERFIEERSKIDRLEMSCSDISKNIQPYLDQIFQLGADMKVPRKAKPSKFKKMECHY